MSDDDPSDPLAARVAAILAGDTWCLETLRTVRALGLPDWAIGAGFVRARVWDALAGNQRTPLADIDVLYFDPAVADAAADSSLERRLSAIRPDVPWSVRNQARMHLRNAARPYRDTADALRFWLETPTAVAARLEENDAISVLAPLGLDDLFALAVRPTPETLKRPDKMAAYRKRLADKGWQRIWPELRVESG